MYDYLAKIILLGPSGSGKYTIFSFLCSKASADKHQDRVCCTDL
jgi:guanylate kinase